jgi:hypothetical protein
MASGSGLLADPLREQFLVEVELVHEKLVRRDVDVDGLTDSAEKCFAFSVTMAWAPQRTAAARMWRSFGSFVIETAKLS